MGGLVGLTLIDMKDSGEVWKADVEPGYEG